MGRPKRHSRPAATRAAPADINTSPAPQNAPLAPWPMIDRYPTIVGSNVNLQYISAVMRSAAVGDRRQYVDLLNELLERDPHGFAVLSQRILTVAGGRLEVAPMKVAGEREASDKSKEVAAWVATKLHAIPDFNQALTGLLWALFYGVTACEVSWRYSGKPGDMWTPNRLHFVHSRRLNYPDPGSWDVRIQDFGGMDPAQESTMGYGINIADYPGKFIVHTPQLRGDYPTRDGLGRQLAWYFAFKILGIRGASTYLERFAKPWAIAYYSTQQDGKPRAASKEDIDVADAAIKALGLGSLSGATIPDSVKVELAGPGAGAAGRALMHGQFVDIINAEISKAVLGQTLTTETNGQGSNALGKVHKEGAKELSRFDAACLAQTLRQQLVVPLIRFNRPEDLEFAPLLRIHVDDMQDPVRAMDMAAKAVLAGLPLDADEFAERIGLPLIPKTNAGDIRRMYPLAQLLPVNVQSLIQLEDGETLINPDDVAAQATLEAAKAAKSAAGSSGSGRSKANGEDWQHTVPTETEKQTQ